MNGWIILHKKIWESENFKGKNKATLMIVWIWLLTHCDLDGKVTCGRMQIAKDTGIGESSVKRCLEQFRDNMRTELSYKATNSFTTIHILNWHEYQHKVTKQVTSNRPASDQQVTTNKQLNNKTINKEYIHLKLSTDEYEELKKTFPLKDVKNECLKADDWLANTSRRYKDFPAFMRNWLRKCSDIREPIRKDNFASKYAKELSGKMGDI